MKIPILEVPEKHPKLVLMFEKETSKKVIFKKSGKITKQFKYWLRQKIKYKTLICKDPNCPDYGKEFPSKKALTTHLNYHKRGYRDKMIKAHNTPEAKENHLKAMKEAYKRPKVRERRSKVSKEVHNRPGVKEKKSKLMEELYSRPEYRENISNKMKEVWNRPGYKESRSGENHPLFGKRGEESPIYGRYGKESNTFKEDAGYVAKHIWIRMHFPPEDVCENKCEICGKFRLDLELAQFIHNNKRNIEDPMIDYLYICPYNEENACHRIYDDNLFEKEKEELLTGAITREEKLKRVREYVMKIKKEVK